MSEKKIQLQKRIGLPDGRIFCSYGQLALEEHYLAGEKTSDKMDVEHFSHITTLEKVLCAPPGLWFGLQDLIERDSFFVAPGGIRLRREHIVFLNKLQLTHPLRFVEVTGLSRYPYYALEEGALRIGVLIPFMKDMRGFSRALALAFMAMGGDGPETNFFKKEGREMLFEQSDRGEPVHQAARWFPEEITGCIASRWSLEKEYQRQGLRDRETAAAVDGFMFAPVRSQEKWMRWRKPTDPWASTHPLPEIPANKQER